ncbi:MAG: DUF503 domain-containing protein [Tissierellia bacterium]|nr:DUF503 domain-containing protein [Tissierellia bacterium]
MRVGTCEVKIMIFESNSLKEKRQIVKSIIGKIQSKFKVSVAEVGLNDSWKTSIIGFACVTNDAVFANQIIYRIIEFIDGDSRVEILDYNIEIL